MVIDLGYLKKVTKRIMTLVLSLIRHISSIQNGCILHAIFDCFYNSFNSRTSHKKGSQKDTDSKEKQVQF